MEIFDIYTEYCVNYYKSTTNSAMCVKKIMKLILALFNLLHVTTTRPIL